MSSAGQKGADLFIYLFIYFKKRIFAVVVCCVPDALFNPECMLVQQTLLLLQVLQLRFQFYQSVAELMCIFS